MELLEKDALSCLQSPSRGLFLALVTQFTVMINASNSSTSLEFLPHFFLLFCCDSEVKVKSIILPLTRTAAGQFQITSRLRRDPKEAEGPWLGSEGGDSSIPKRAVTLRMRVTVY